MRTAIITWTISISGHIELFTSVFSEMSMCQTISDIIVMAILTTLLQEVTRPLVSHRRVTRHLVSHRHIMEEKVSRR